MSRPDTVLLGKLADRPAISPSTPTVHLQSADALLMEVVVDPGQRPNFRARVQLGGLYRSQVARAYNILTVILGNVTGALVTRSPTTPLFRNLHLGVLGSGLLLLRALLAAGSIAEADEAWPGGNRV